MLWSHREHGRLQLYLMKATSNKQNDKGSVQGKVLVNEQGGLQPQLYLSLWLLNRPTPKGEPLHRSALWALWGMALGRGSQLMGDVEKVRADAGVWGDVDRCCHLLSLPSPYLGDSSKGLKSFWSLSCASLLRQDHVDEGLVCIVKVTGGEEFRKLQGVLCGWSLRSNWAR